MSTVGKMVELLEDMAFENPPPEERWFFRDDFDPMHGLSELRYAASLGRIDLDESTDRLRFRFTSKGRAFLSERENAARKQAASKATGA